MSAKIMLWQHTHEMKNPTILITHLGCRQVSRFEYNAPTCFEKGGSNEGYKSNVERITVHIFTLFRFSGTDFGYNKADR